MKIDLDLSECGCIVCPRCRSTNEEVHVEIIPDEDGETIALALRCEQCGVMSGVDGWGDPVAVLRFRTHAGHTKVTLEVADRRTPQ
jgi:hypothetical protein